LLFWVRYKFILNEINVIANNDIVFDKTIKYVAQYNSNEILALSRREKYCFTYIFKFKYGNSQDVWVFNGIPKNEIYSDFMLGLPGCENALAYEIHKSNFDILNPASLISCKHFHKDQNRNYTAKDRIIWNYKNVEVDYGKYPTIKSILLYYLNRLYSSC
jgi:hypothetical protein